MRIRAWRLIAAAIVMSGLALGATAPGQLGYEGQPGNQGGGNSARAARLRGPARQPGLTRPPAHCRGHLTAGFA